MPWTLRPNATGPLYKQVFDTLRLSIVEGLLAAGQRLPATRDLAQQLGVARNTVITAYEMLAAEGYAISKLGSGFFVASHLPEPALFDRSLTRIKVASETPIALSTRGEYLASASRPVPPPEQCAFAPGLPALEAFPFEQWQRCMHKATRAPTLSLLKYDGHGGHPQLKRALRDYLQSSRGVHCETEQIIVVGGSQAALDLTARLLINEGEIIAVENPGYLGAKDAFRAAGAELMPIAVDEGGLRVGDLMAATTDTKRKRAATVKLVYTTPSYQFPLGKTLSLSRRMDLLQWAAEHNAFVIEDDYDSEFRYGERPLSSLQGLDQQGRVIYMGTFSKVMFPSLRLGYIVVPPNLTTAFATALRKTGQDAPLLLQAAMAEFMNAGYFVSHLRKMRKLYWEKQQLFVELAQAHLSPWLDVQAAKAGMQLACPYRIPVDEKLLLSETTKRGLVISTLSRYFIGAASVNGLYLGYTGVPLEEMEVNLVKLRECFG